MIMELIDNLLGGFLHIIRNIYVRFATKRALNECAECGKNTSFSYPCLIRGFNQETGKKYIHLGDNVSIGANSTIFATRAHLYIGNKSFSGPNLTIMTGNHPFDLIGSYIADNKKAEIEKKGGDISGYDSDVIIEEDVWIGCNVTILKGVHLGRGSIVSAGSVVTKSFPPYSIIGGVPAKLIKKRWNSDAEIEEHERMMYDYHHNK